MKANTKTVLAIALLALLLLGGVCWFKLQPRGAAREQNAPAIGSYGGTCFPNKTCDAGLGCRNGICLKKIYAHSTKGQHSLGETCVTDCDCVSHECKGFKCVEAAKKLLANGKHSIWPGSCLSCQTNGGVCMPCNDDDCRHWYRYE